MSSVEGDTSRRMARRCVTSLRPWARLWDLLIVPLIIALALLGFGPGLLQHGHAQSQNEDSGAVQHIVVTLFKSRTLRLQKQFCSAVFGGADILGATTVS